MSIAIIAEYNPFHNGHIYQLNETKRLFPNDKIIIIMSGKYVQRGEIAIASFNKRKKIALKYGASKVIELPFKYATQAAHIFAKGAISIVAKNKIDKIIFGSESNNVKRLLDIAHYIIDNSDKYNKILKRELKLGNSFPKSANIALFEITNENINLPNDILGLEYIKAIIRNNYSITPYSMKRTIAFHSNKTLENFASASYIRGLIKQKKLVHMYTPMRINNKKIEKIEDKYKTFQKIVNKYSKEKLANIKLVSEGMENLFKKHINAQTYEEFISLCNSRRYTSSRIKRVMLYILLEIKK